MFLLNDNYRGFQESMIKEEIIFPETKELGEQLILFLGK